MKKVYLADSGREKRYNKAIASGDEKIQEIVTLSKKHIFSKGYRTDEYKFYEPFKSKILRDTQNYKEKAIIVDDNGTIIFEKSGTSTAIQFSQSELSRMKGYKLIHNHPSGATLSFQDVMLAMEYELKEIVAVSGKGIYYRLIIKSKKKVNELVLQYDIAKKEASAIMYKLVSDGIFTKKQADLEYQHFVMSIFTNSIKGISYEQTKY